MTPPPTPITTSIDLDVAVEDVPELHPALARSRRMLEAIEAAQDVDLSCPTCNAVDWIVWRSILGEDRRQNDVMCKCQTCWHVWWHGVPLSRDAWDRELERRDGKRSIDAVGDSAGELDVQERLQLLGYIGGTDAPHGENVRYTHGPGSPAGPR